jgi:hypothetical protein
MLRLGSSSCSSSGYCSVAEVVTTVLLNNIYIIYISHKSSSHLWSNFFKKSYEVMSIINEKKDILRGLQGSTLGYPLSRTEI